MAAMFAAASTTPPAAFDPAWSGKDLALPGTEPDGYADWERVLLSQIADLEDFLTHPPGPQARFGADAPRPPGSGARATPARWYNFDPATYLECAVACSLGGWDAADGARVPLPTRPGSRHPLLRPHDHHHDLGRSGPHRGVRAGVRVTGVPSVPRGRTGDMTDRPVEITDRGGWWLALGRPHPALRPFLRSYNGYWETSPSPPGRGRCRPAPPS